MFRALLASLTLALFLVPPALAHSVTVGSLTLTDLWMRATPPGAATSGGYLAIANAGPEVDRLIGASTPLAGMADFHDMALKDGVMTMRVLADGIEIPAGGSVTLAPGGLHVMFTGLKEPLVEGEKMPVTLIFEKAGRIDTFLHIKAVGASDGGRNEHGGEMKMDKSE